MQRRLYIDEAHMALDIFLQRFRDSALPYTAVAVIFILSSTHYIKPSIHMLSSTYNIFLPVLPFCHINITFCHITITFYHICLTFYHILQHLFPILSCLSHMLSNLSQIMSQLQGSYVQLWIEKKRWGRLSWFSALDALLIS